VDIKRFWAIVIAVFLVIMLGAHTVGRIMFERKQRQATQLSFILFTAQEDMEELLKEKPFPRDRARAELQQANGLIELARERLQKMGEGGEAMKLKMSIDSAETSRDRLKERLEREEAAPPQPGDRKPAEGP
jgi:hypothetical protein